MVFETFLNNDKKRVTFATNVQISSTNQKSLNGQGIMVNQVVNKSLQNLIKVSENGKENFDPSMINCRLIHQLYNNYQSKIGESANDFWFLVTKDYNFVNFSNHSVDEIKNYWKQIPSMEKRKLMIESSDFDEQTNRENNNSKKQKKSSSKKNNNLKSMNENDHFEQSQPFDLSSSNKAMNEEIRNVASETLDDKEIKELAKEEYRLKISILKIRLEMLQKQYEKYFG